MQERIPLEKVGDGSEISRQEPLGILSIGSNWTESSGRPLEEGESQFFHSTYAYNISPEQYRDILEKEEFVLDRRMFVDPIPQTGYGQVPNVEMRTYKENPDELILFRFITKDEEPFLKIQAEGLDLKDIGKKEGLVGGPEKRFDPNYLGYALKLRKVGEEQLGGYKFPHRVVTFEVVERMPIIPE
ncbi:MAG: hypothetical protein Q8R39_01445 [bacterium]|nr:hypothetical protein [bacterium]MDZ4284703.1 hypothetical protein [Patescibacteria group bacterium]